MRTVVVSALLLASIASAQTGAVRPDVARAQKKIDDFKYAEALKLLDAAWARPGNDRPTVLEILKLQAIVAAILGQADQARAQFRMLLYVAPEFVLEGADLSPKVTSLFFEMKGRMASEEALQFEAVPAEVADGRVRSIGVLVRTDPLNFAKQVRFHLVGDPNARDVPIGAGAVQLAIDAPSAEWWAELLGENSRSLRQVGSADAPLLAGTRSLLPRQVEPPAVIARTHRLRPVAYGLAGAGAVAAAVGILFGAQSAGARTRLADATRDGSGRITSLTRQQGLELSDQVRAQATVANSLFVGAAALVGAGVTLFFLSDSVGVGVAPGGGGVGVTMELP